MNSRHSNNVLTESGVKETKTKKKKWRKTKNVCAYANQLAALSCITTTITIMNREKEQKQK